MTQAHLGRRPPMYSPLCEKINNPYIDRVTHSKAIKGNEALHTRFCIASFDARRNVRSVYRRHACISIYRTSVKTVCFDGREKGWRGGGETGETVDNIAVAYDGSQKVHGNCEHCCIESVNVKFKIRKLLSSSA